LHGGPGGLGKGVEKRFGEGFEWVAEGRTGDHERASSPPVGVEVASHGRGDGLLGGWRWNLGQFGQGGGFGGWGYVWIVIAGRAGRQR
jgi:hypothetical protein